jgi:hypothetical protein
LSERGYSSSAVTSSVVSHVVALMKSHAPDLDIELLRRNFPFADDEERDALIDNVYDTVHHFVSQYDFSTVNDQDDNGSPDT